MDGYFQLLETCSSEADRKRYIEIIEERIESLKEMLEELFTYTKLKNETYELKKERQNLTQILLFNISQLNFFCDEHIALMLSQKTQLAADIFYLPHITTQYTNQCNNNSDQNPNYNIHVKYLVS